MPQVAARINADYERMLQDYFRTKSAGAEFILPWAIDTIFRAINGCREIFSEAELKTIVEAHKDAKLSQDNTRLQYLLLRISDACDLNNLHVRNGASKSSLLGKLQTLDDIQATALMVWASAFWVSRKRQGEDIEEYIRQS